VNIGSNSSVTPHANDTHVALALQFDHGSDVRRFTLYPLHSWKNWTRRFDDHKQTRSKPDHAAPSSRLAIAKQYQPSAVRALIHH